MPEITAREKSIRALLGEKYTVDSYQREYKWAAQQVTDLMDDLLAAFAKNYQAGHEQSNARAYGQYFLGPIIVNKDDDNNYIVDGQQRLTTLTLALICLLHMTSEEQQHTLRNLIYSDDYGMEAFNLDVPDRNECLLRLYKDEPSDAAGTSESIRNLIERHAQLRDRLREELSPEQIPIFAVWFINKVILVEIATSSDADAYTIFETMNDRGLRLAPAEMLKGYLLSKIGEPEWRNNANTVWKTEMDRLTENKGEDSDAIKSWLRARHATTITDFEKIGSQFHRWVRDNADLLSLNTSQDLVNFITKDFTFYARHYSMLRRTAEQHNPDERLERVHYLDQHSFTLQYPLLLSAIAPGDSPQNIRKLRVVAAYLDILIHRLIGNGKSVAESKMRGEIFALAPKLRNKSAEEIADFLVGELEKNDEQQTLVPDLVFPELAKEPGQKTLASDFSLNQQNRPRIHRILARITDYVMTQSKQPSRYADYFVSGNQSFQVEHIWHANYSAVCREEGISKKVLNEHEFNAMRNNIGGLLLLPSINNQAYGAQSYTQKRKYYVTQNLLAASLHETCYAAQTGFRQFVESSGLPFTPHEKFTVAALQQRQDLYRKIADQIWHPNRIKEALK